MVANGSAVGEQYVDLLPESDDGPFLRDGDEIALERTDTPIATTKLLVDLDRTVNSVNKKSLTTVIDELGKAFQGTGEDLGQIIDTSNSFIRTANANFDLTTDLLEDGNVVLSTQLDKASAIRSFAKDLSLFSDTLVRSDEDLRAVIEDGSATANQLRTFLEENQVDLGELINQLVTTGEITGKNIDGAETVLLVYPYVVAGGYTVVAKDPGSGLFDAHFGLILTQTPEVCTAGYEGTDTRIPQDGSNRPMNEDARCTEPASQSNARGGQHAPGRAAASYRAPVVGTYDRDTGPRALHRPRARRRRQLHRRRGVHVRRGVLEVAAAAAARRGRGGNPGGRRRRRPTSPLTTTRATEDMTEDHPGHEPAPETADSPGPSKADRISPRLSRGIAVVLAGLAVLAAVAVVVQLVVLQPRFEEVAATEQARIDAVRVAEKFAIEVNNYDSETIEDYQGRVSELLTTKFAGEFEQAMGDIVSSVGEADMTSKGEVITSAVASVDPDSADVLVVADADVTTVFDDRARHFRWEVSLVKVDGAWLVDNFTPVT